MVSAFVLITCDLGAEEDVISHLKTIDGVKEVHVHFWEALNIPTLD